MSVINEQFIKSPRSQIEIKANGATAEWIRWIDGDTSGNGDGDRWSSHAKLDFPSGKVRVCVPTADLLFEPSAWKSKGSQRGENAEESAVRKLIYCLGPTCIWESKYFVHFQIETMKWNYKYYMHYFKKDIRYIFQRCHLIAVVQPHSNEKAKLNWKSIFPSTPLEQHRGKRHAAIIIKSNWTGGQEIVDCGIN